MNTATIPFFHRAVAPDSLISVFWHFSRFASWLLLAWSFSLERLREFARYRQSNHKYVKSAKTRDQEIGLNGSVKKRNCCRVRTPGTRSVLDSRAGRGIPKIPVDWLRETRKETARGMTEIPRGTGHTNTTQKKLGHGWAGVGWRRKVGGQQNKSPEGRIPAGGPIPQHRDTTVFRSGPPGVHIYGRSTQMSGFILKLDGTESDIFQNLAECSYSFNIRLNACCHHAAAITTAAGYAAASNSTTSLLLILTTTTITTTSTAPYYYYNDYNYHCCCQ